MRSEIVTPMSRRAEELAYVTAHLGDLQGLVVAPFVASFAAWALWVRLHGFCLQQLFLLAAALPVSMVAAAAITRWYRARYGYVKTGDSVAVPSGLTLLSLYGDETAIERRPRRSPGTRRGLQSQPNSVFPLWWAILLINFGLLAGSSGHARSSIMLVPMTWLLLPRCSYATPASLPLQLRRALAIAALALFVVLQMAYLFGPVSKWSLLADVFGSYFLLAAYDHWLLVHLLGGTHPTQMEADHG